MKRQAEPPGLLSLLHTSPPRTQTILRMRKPRLGRLGELLPMNSLPLESTLRTPGASWVSCPPRTPPLMHTQRNCFSVTGKMFPKFYKCDSPELNTVKNSELMGSIEMLVGFLVTCREVFQTVTIFDL